jgi:diguanylate cyclase (GGDEF)-like protein
LSAAPLSARETNEYMYDVCQENKIRLIFLKDILMTVDRQMNQMEGDYEYPVWLEKRLASRAMYDTLTGLPTRYLFQDRLKQAVTYARVYQSQLAVIIIKIERNDVAAEGPARSIDDQILIEVARRLTKCGKESDTLSYLGNKAFVMLLENVTEEGSPESVADQIQGSLAEPMKIEGSDFQLQTNVYINPSQDYDLDKFETFCLTEIESIHDTEKRTEALEQHDIQLGK